MSRQHIRSEELVAFALDGEPPSLYGRRHLGDCLLCQQQAIHYQKTAAYLHSRLYRSQCPSATTLSYYCLPGALPDPQQRQIAEHLAHCPLCAAEWAETRQFLDTP